MTMAFHVHSVELDLASKWYARVVISDDQAVFLKFDDLPSDDQIQEAAQRFVSAREVTNAFAE